MNLKTKINLLKERHELEVKIEKAINFLDSNQSKECSFIAIDLLKKQIHFMTKYRDTISSRLRLED